MRPKQQVQLTSHWFCPSPECPQQCVQTHVQLCCRLPKLPLSQTHHSGKRQKLGGSDSTNPGGTGRCCGFEIQLLKLWSSGCARLRFPTEAGGDDFPRRSCLPLCTQAVHARLSLFQSKMLFWSSCLERDAEVSPSNKHFKFPHYFSSKHFMAICGLSFACSSVWKMSVAALQRQEK